MEKQILTATETSYLPSSLVETIAVPFSERQAKVFMLIDDEDFSRVKRKLKKELEDYGIYPTESYLDEGILALKQYYAICFLDDNPHAISDTLDPFWHTHILFTVEYHAFCDKLGIDYMHHVPHDPEDDVEALALHVLYNHTQDVFQKCYNWISPLFNPLRVPPHRLVCKHYTQNKFVLDSDYAFAQDNRLHELQHAHL